MDVRSFIKAVVAQDENTIRNFFTRLMYDTRMSWGMKFAGEV